MSVGYSFGFGLDVDLGYKYSDDAGVDNHTLGVLLHYGFDVTLPPG